MDSLNFKTITLAVFFLALVAVAGWIAYSYWDCAQSGGSLMRGLFSRVCVVS